MNFKDWKKISEDGKTCTLEHPKGHVMTIAVGALPRIHREALKRLEFADGGSVSRKMYADSEEPISKDDSAPDEDTSTSDSQMPNTVNHSPITINVGAPAAASQPPPPPAQPIPPDKKQQDYDNLPLIPSGSGGMNDSNVPIPATPAASTNLHQSGNLAPGAFNKNTEALGEESGQIEAAKQQAGAEAEKQYLSNEQSLNDRSAQGLRMMLDETKAHAEDQAALLGKIGPRNFMNNMSTGQKVSTAIGLVLGGLSVPFGGQNFAMDFLNKQIDRDIDSQKAQAEGETKNIYGAYKDMYHDDVLATAAMKMSNLHILQHNMALRAHQIGTPEAINNFRKATQSILLQQNEQMQKAYSRIQEMDREGKLPEALGGKSTGTAPQQQEPVRTDRVLAPGAQGKYDYSQSKYNNVMSPARKAAIDKEYQTAQQADKALDQIDQIWPEILHNRTYGGYLADKVNPAAVGGAAGAVAEGVGALTAPATGGASLLAALPAAVAAGGAGTVLGAGVKQGLRAVGGQTQTRYETAVDSLMGVIGSAVGPSGLTPSLKGEIAKEFVPTAADSDKSAQYKLDKLKEKIILMTPTPTLDAEHMTNRSRRK